MQLYFHEKFLLHFVHIFLKYKCFNNISWIAKHMDKNSNVLFKKRLCSIAMRLWPIDAELNVQKKYYTYWILILAIQLLLSKDVLRWAIDFLRKKKLVQNCFITNILVFTFKYIHSFELENKLVFHCRIWAENFKRQSAQSNVLAIFQISIQLHFFWKYCTNLSIHN